MPGIGSNDRGNSHTQLGVYQGILDGLVKKYTRKSTFLGNFRIFCENRGIFFTILQKIVTRIGITLAVINIFVQFK